MRRVQERVDGRLGDVAHVHPAEPHIADRLRVHPLLQKRLPEREIVLEKIVGLNKRGGQAPLADGPLDFDFRAKVGDVGSLFHAVDG